MERTPHAPGLTSTPWGGCCRPPVQVWQSLAAGTDASQGCIFFNSGRHLNRWTIRHGRAERTAWHARTACSHRSPLFPRLLCRHIPLTSHQWLSILPRLPRPGPNPAHFSSLPASPGFICSGSDPHQLPVAGQLPALHRPRGRVYYTLKKYKSVDMKNLDSELRVAVAVRHCRRCRFQLPTKYVLAGESLSTFKGVD